jgi:hypothetical protein
VIELQTPCKVIVKVCLDWNSRRTWQHLTVAGSRAWGAALTRKDAATMICGAATFEPIGILVRHHHCAWWLHLGRKTMGGFYVLDGLLPPLGPAARIARVLLVVHHSPLQRGLGCAARHLSSQLAALKSCRRRISCPPPSWPHTRGSRVSPYGTLKVPIPVPDHNVP